MKKVRSISDPMFTKLSNVQMSSLKGGEATVSSNGECDRTYVTINTDQHYWGDGTNKGQNFVVDCGFQE